MFINHRLIAFLIVVLGFAGCSKPSDDTTILINIENEFTVSMIENLNPGANSLNLRINTIKLLECSNYEIVHSHSTSEERVIASIDYLQEPETCNPASVQATSDISLGKLENGSYTFQLNLEKGSIVNEGTLFIDNEQYSIELNSEHGIDFPLTRLNKIPDNYIWGEINVASDAPNDIIDEILVEFNLLGETSTLSSGNYGHFKINNNAFDFTTSTSLLFSSAETKPFIFKLSGTQIALKVILENYRDTYDGKLDIQMFTSEGGVL